MIIGNEVIASRNRYWRIYIKYELKYSQKMQGNPEPVIAVEGINIDAGDIQVIGSNADTVKFIYGGITYIKFKAKDLIEEFRRFNGKILVNVVGRGNLNKWGGRTTPQIMIDDIEIKSLEGF